MSFLQITACTLGIGAAAAAGGAGAGPSPDQFLGAVRAVLSEHTAPLVGSRSFEGVIRATDEEAKTVTLDNSEGETLRVSFDDETRYTLNGKASTRAEAVKVGRSAVVTYNDERLAIRFAVTQGE